MHGFTVVPSYYTEMVVVGGRPIRVEAAPDDIDEVWRWTLAESDQLVAAGDAADLTEALDRARAARSEFV